MNPHLINQELNSLVLNKAQGPRPPDFTTHNNEKHRARAYINPQIVNYEFIKRSFNQGSLPSGNKILFNPNFKGNVFSDVQKGSNGSGNSSSCNRQLSYNTVKQNLDHIQRDYETKKIEINCNIQNSGRAYNDSKISSSSHQAQRYNPNNQFDNTNNAPQPNKNVYITQSSSVSRFKKINAPSLKTNSTNYTWSKDKLSLHKTSQNFKNEKPKNYILPSSAYKYQPSKKVVKAVETTEKKPLIKKSPPIYLSKTKVINKSKTKLINNNNNNYQKAKPSSKQPVVSKITIYKNIKSPVVRVASLVRNKYRYCKSMKLSRNSRFKLDKRKKLPETTKNKSKSSEIHDIRKLFPTNFYNTVKLPSNYYPQYNCGGSLPEKNIHTWRKKETSEVTEGKANRFLNRKVVKIGGILYKSTTNKLTLANVKENPKESKKSISSKVKGKKNHIVYVRGEKFILDKNGKTLTRQKSNEEKTKRFGMNLRRIDIGGVTYIQKSKNVLVRTNVRQATYFVKKAKYKSIATLTNLYKRSTMPCMIFHKFGRCIRHTKGLCMYKHDIKNIALCKKFLKGKCDDENCLLSHEVIQEKMATCHFFLNGFCTRENCPFLHVKLNKNAAICEKFLQGFCDLGKNCSKRHLHLCPEFDKNGTCSQGTKCHYPHKTVDKNKESPKTSQSDVEEKSSGETETVQYYVKSGQPFTKQKQKKVKRSLLKLKTPNKKDTKKVKKGKRKSFQSTESSELNNETIDCVPKRIKLDKLPCFIPLNSDL